ncbi:MAG: carboxymuconolactone decarboxylase [Chitinophagaceae bacterium]|nr:carboxymuconolactone decarboxylase [Chitinophagaceae bacterium]
MPHISLENDVPGIRSLVLFRPETGKHLYDLVQILLRGESTINEGDRELIAAYVSHRNNCSFCRNSHAAAARCLYENEQGIVNQVLSDPETASIPELLKSLLNIAGKVQIQGKAVLPQDIERARNAGANDRAIHDTVLIAATFSMFNRHVDGLDSFTPIDENLYNEMGMRMAKGYNFPVNNQVAHDIK